MFAWFQCCGPLSDSARRRPSLGKSLPFLLSPQPLNHCSRLAPSSFEPFVVDTAVCKRQESPTSTEHSTQHTQQRNVLCCVAETAGTSMVPMVRNNSVLVFKKASMIHSRRCHSLTSPISCTNWWMAWSVLKMQFGVNWGQRGEGSNNRLVPPVKSRYR